VYRNVNLLCCNLQNHPSMRNYTCPGTDDHFTDGITKGDSWYPVTGGMQDYNYVFGDCMEITLELSCCKYPLKKELPNLWKANRNSLIEYIKQVIIFYVLESVDHSEILPSFMINEYKEGRFSPRPYLLTRS
jgi:hypothetical protein